LLPEEIFGTEEVPEYILSDSSTDDRLGLPFGVYLLCLGG
jgi:hypothetical protein